MIDDTINPEPDTPAYVQQKYSQLVDAILHDEETPDESIRTQNELTRMILEHEADMRLLIPEAKVRKTE